jgi:hypothetical protein
VPRKYSDECDYVCPNCQNDDTEIIEQEDVIDDYSGEITGIRRQILCNECGHEWKKRHMYPKEDEDEDF